MRRGGHDIDHGEAVAQPHLVVVEIVGRCDLHAPAAEGRVHVAVADHGNLAVGQRQAQPLADQVTITLIFGMHRDRGIAQQGFRTRRGDDQELAAAVAERIAQMPETALFLHGNDFEVRKRRLQHGIPIDEPLAPINEALAIQPHEHFGHGLGQAGVHREAIARPVDGGAEPPHLLGDDTARLLLPLPDASNEGIPSEIGAVLAFGVELSFDDHLGRDAGVIGAGLPQRVAARHPVVADQCIHDRVLEGMTHVQRARHIGRRNHDRIGDSRAARREQTLRLPRCVNSCLDVGRREGFIHGSAHRRASPCVRRACGQRAPAALRANDRGPARTASPQCP